MILVDTDIFIEALKNNFSAIDSLRNIGFENIAVSAFTLMELYFGAMNKKEQGKIKSRLKQLRVVQLDQDISKTATDLVEKYAKSHGLRIPDALIAATAIYQHTGGRAFITNDTAFKRVTETDMLVLIELIA